MATKTKSAPKKTKADLKSLREFIHIKGARSNNLKNVEVFLPKKKLIVVTGLSGSGKSSLIMDTLYAEGQRRYVESLSSYARQFLNRMKKPEVDFIKGICPAIAIEQKVTTSNARSTVGSLTEIYDFMRLLYARIGKTYSPISGDLVRKHEVSDVVNYIQKQKSGTKIILMIPIQKKYERTLHQELYLLLQKGFNRLYIGEELVDIEDKLESKDKDLSKSVTKLKTPIHILIDRFAVSDEEENKKRIADSVLTAFSESEGDCVVQIMGGERVSYNNRFELDGILFQEPTHQLFNYNNPYGACPKCEGYGRILGIDPEKVVPDDSRSVYDEAIACWRGEKGKMWLNALVKSAHKFDFPVHTPWRELSDDQKQLVWEGNDYFDGVETFFAELQKKTYKIQNRVLLARYRGRTNCNECKGGRLRKEARYVIVGGKNISELINIPIDELYDFFEKLKLSEHDATIAERILTEVQSRLQTMMDVGLSYLSLDRMSSTLSGGETQRINLTRTLGSNFKFKKGVKESLTSLYISGKEELPLPTQRRTSSNKIEIKGARQHNLKNIDVTIPLNTLTVVSGVSGSGKTSLVKHILYPALKKELNEAISKSPGKHDSVTGSLKNITQVEMINQSPIGKSSRSNPVTYVKAYDAIRKLFANQQLSKIRGYTPKHFSFNVDGGRCETCKGDGSITVEMQFLADVKLVCDECGGKKFKDDVIEVEFNGKSIHDVLNLSIEEALDFFVDQRDIISRIQPLYDVGLGYIKMGQSSSTLSGGEAQRVKLASFLTRENHSKHIFFIFDEPTTGLHFHDIRKLMDAFNALVEHGHTVLVVEHNMDVIKMADYLIDLGPTGGKFATRH